MATPKVVGVDSTDAQKTHSGDGAMSGTLKLARYTIGGALLAVYAIDFLAPLIGINIAHVPQAIIAIVGGGGTLAFILKAHLVSI